MSQKKYFCNRSIKPWIVLLVGLSAFLFIWVLLNHEEIVLFGEMEPQQAPEVAPVQQGEPVFPKPIQNAAFSQPFSSNHYGLAAITKATPHGGVQFVANRTQTAFQESLKDAVNAVIPYVCDIHAIWLKRSTGVRRAVGGQNLQFQAPFKGGVDKFIQNKGYENIGAGILVDKRGYILTNHHVVENATDIVVTVPGNPAQDYTGKIIAHDVLKDLALIKLKTNDTFGEARLGDSSFTQIGDYVIAVGSPFGMEQTVTSGIISGVRKSIKIDGVRYKNMFQTDAPINRGSSGGALVNLSGEVIGVTTAIYAPTGVFSGTGFVIPINDAKDFLVKNLDRAFALVVNKRGMFTDAQKVVKQHTGNPIPVKFGIEGMTLDPIMARQLGADQGVLVNRVFVNSPAYFADVQRGDIITSIAGLPVVGKDDIPGIMSHFAQGDTVNLHVVRNGRRDEFLVKLR